MVKWREDGCGVEVSCFWWGDEGGWGGEGIEGLQLGQDVGAGGVTVQGKQGGVADQIGEHRGDFHSIPSNLV